MLSVDRGDFTAVTPYGDHPVAIGYGATISAPHMVTIQFQIFLVKRLAELLPSEYFRSLTMFALIVKDEAMWHFH